MREGPDCLVGQTKFGGSVDQLNVQAPPQPRKQGRSRLCQYSYPHAPRARLTTTARPTTPGILHGLLKQLVSWPTYPLRSTCRFPARCRNECCTTPGGCPISNTSACSAVISVALQYHASTIACPLRSAEAPPMRIFAVLGHPGLQHAREVDFTAHVQPIRGGLDGSFHLHECQTVFRKILQLLPVDALQRRVTPCT